MHIIRALDETLLISLAMVMRKNITGLFGNPLKHSFSPTMHNAAFKALGMNDWEYQLFEFPPESLDQQIQQLRDNEDIRGVNVTVPYKVDVMSYLDRITPLAAKIGAVNTIEKKEGKLIGHNTDAPGFYASLIEDAGYPLNHKAKVIVLIGAGGAARSILNILNSHKCFQELYLYDIDREKVKSLVNSLARPSKRIINCASAHELMDMSIYADLVINASGLGSSHGIGQSPLPPEVFHEDQWVYDLGYNPAETELLRLAKSSGANTCNGLGMLIRQGALAFEIFTGRKPSVEVMRWAILQS